jgi:phospho-N-acetylmuramoyl-pentapeptide-transferase
MEDLIRIVGPAVLTFFIGILITPFFTRYFYKYKMWKKSPRSLSDTSDTFKNIHNTDHEISTPRVGGVIIWMSVLLTVFLVYVLTFLTDNQFIAKLSFFSREQTFVPLAAFFFAAIVGLMDDLLQISGQGTYARDSLIYRKVKIIIVMLIGFAISLWFYYKLDIVSVHIPFGGDLFLGAWFIPFFIVVMLAVFSTSVIDGLDGLSGGVLAAVFSAYALIAFMMSQYDISALCGAIAGGILAFLWFNIPPARFYMGETGILGLTVVLSVVAFLTDSVLFLPIIALPLVITTASVIVQVTAYRFFNKKRVFRVSPLHHHFQALGWPREKVVMR